MIALGVPGGVSAGDHLACYKVKDTLPKQAFAGVDLLSNDGGPNNTGCTISARAKFCCDPVDKVGVPPQVGGSGPGAPTTRFCCYKVKCPRATGATLDFTDQFGSRALPVTTPKMICAPVPTSSSTTTTTISTTTSTGPPCLTGACQACGSCGHGECHAASGGAGCGAPTPTPVCIDTSTCTVTECNTDGDCTNPSQPKCVFGGSVPPSSCCALCP
ncbi:MAG TPA: hypothetical protein VKA21_11930 [Candidatus Binatia bacterium]|nr:hypothetical protein [Candidatus Binatia bacterium]